MLAAGPRTLGGFASLMLAAGSAPAQADFYDEHRIPQLRLVFPTADWHDRLVDNYRNGNDQYVSADLVVDGVLLPNVGVQHKGDTSYRGELRENFKITLDAFQRGQDYQGFDKITLDAGALSNVFTEVAALWGLSEFQVAPKANLARLVAGTKDLSFDLGVFTNTERVDGRFIDREFIGDGHRYWPLRGVQPFEYLGDQVDDYYDTYQYEGGDYDTRFVEIAGGSIALENAARKDVRDAMEPFADLDACFRNIVGNRMLGNGDGFENGNNYYLCESVRHQGRLTPVCWDLDLAFVRSHDHPVPKAWDTPDFPLKKAFLHKHAEERAHTFVRHYLAGPFVEGRIETRLHALKDLALPWMLGSEYDPIDSVGQANAAVNAIVNWIDDTRERLEVDPFYTRALPRFTALHHEPEVPTDGDVVWAVVALDPTSVDVDEVRLWSRVIGGYTSKKMHDDGQHQDGAAGDGVYGAELPVAIAGDVVQYYVEVRPVDISTHHYGFFPEKTAFTPQEYRVRLTNSGPVQLNEFLADNENTDSDEFQEADDWLEVWNTSASSVDLSGAALTDDALRPDRWRFPDGATLAPGEWLRVWADDEPEEGPLHAAFRIAKSGGILQLRAPEADGGALWDEIEYAAQKEDRAYGRVPDGGEHWFHLWDPTANGPMLEPGVAQRYDARSGGSVRDFKLKVEGNIAAGEELEFELRGGTPRGVALLWVSAAPDRLDLGDLGVLAVDLQLSLRFVLGLDSAGEADWKVRVPDDLVGLRFYAQALDQDLSNAVTAWIDN